MPRAAVVVVLGCCLSCACAPRHAPVARRTGQVAALVGVGGLIATAAASRYVEDDGAMMGGFSVMSGGGIVLFAIGELSEPPRGFAPETLEERHRRWAKILTERAAGAARDGRCPRVRRLEKRVDVYDREVHDFVFMRDPAIVRCLALVPAAVEPSPVEPVPAAPVEPTPVPAEADDPSPTPPPAPPAGTPPRPIPRLPDRPDV